MPCTARSATPASAPRSTAGCMPLRHELQNGDQVEIMTARGGTPSPQWERFVVTGKARARIRRFMHQQQRQQHLDAGRAALAKAFRQEGLDGSEKVLEPALKPLKQPRSTISTSRSATAISARRTWCTPPIRSCARRRARRAWCPTPPPRAATGIRAAATTACRSPGWSPAWRSTTPAAATRCRATDRRHRDDRQGRHDPYARLPDAGRASPPRRSASSTWTGTTTLAPAGPAARRQPHRRGSA